MVSRTYLDGLGTRVGGVVRAVVGVIFELQTYRNLCYLALAFPLGLLYFMFFAVGFSLGIGLSVLVIGIPILIAMLVFARILARFERKIAVLLLGVDIPSQNISMPESLTEWKSLTKWIRRLVTNWKTWKAVVYLTTKLALGLVAFTSIVLLLVTAGTMVVVPFVFNQPDLYVGIVPNTVLHPALYMGWNDLLVGLNTVVSLPSWRADTLIEALIVATGGVVLGIVSLHFLNALARLFGWYTRLMLGIHETDSLI